MTPEFWGELIKTFGLPTAMLVVILWTGAKEVWVWGKAYRDVKEDRDRLFELALSATDMGERGKAVAKEAISTGTEYQKYIKYLEAQIEALRLDDVPKKPRRRG